MFGVWDMLADFVFVFMFIFVFQKINFVFVYTFVFVFMNIEVSYLLTEAVVMFVVWDRLADAVDHKCCLERPLRLQYIKVWPLCICSVPGWVFPGFTFVCFMVMYLYFWRQGICIFCGFVFRCALACKGIVMQRLRVLL